MKKQKNGRWAKKDGREGERRAEEERKDGRGNPGMLNTARARACMHAHTCMNARARALLVIVEFKPPGAGNEKTGAKRVQRERRRERRRKGD
jgi:hypothetical protein